jgi:Ni,Fe-hydrogenase III small subunit
LQELSLPKNRDGNAKVNKRLLLQNNNRDNSDRRSRNATPDPKLVIAMGDCGADGGEFGASYASCGAVANVIPVDAVILGCPPSPLQLLQGITELLRRR